MTDLRAPWHAIRAHIRDTNGRTIAAVLVPENERADVARTLASAPALLAAARAALDVLSDLCTDDFSRGGDRPAREALARAVAAATGAAYCDRCAALAPCGCGRSR